jgi:hypothetical protein
LRVGGFTLIIYINCQITLDWGIIMEIKKRYLMAEEEEEEEERQEFREKGLSS